MGKLPMCRVCLVENVRMYVVVNKSLQKLYEKLTDVPFVTEDNRPMLACYFCCTKLKQCWQFQKKCLEAEELFAQMLNEDYEPNPLRNLDQWQFCSGFVKTPIENIDVDHIENIAIKEELPADYERLNIEPKEEHLSDDVEEGHEDNCYSDVDNIPRHYSASDSEDDLPTEGDTEKIEQEVTKRKLRAKKITRKSSNDKDNINARRRLCVNYKRFKCDVCLRSFSEKCSLIDHLRIHTGEKPYICDKCPRSFSKKGNLTYHHRTHTGEKPYKCDICPLSFSKRGNLTRHFRLHDGEKPYKCDICPRRFIQKSNLTRHLRSHTGEKPYICDICLRSFSKKGNLTYHLRTHTGEKPYKCDICLRSFSKKGNLTSHLRTHTGRKP